MKARFVICSDCVVSDAHWINKLLEKYRPDVSPLPFSLLSDQWSKHEDVGQIQKGFLTSFNPDWILNGKGASKKIETVWFVPKKIKEHTHMPDSDAYTIAFDMQALIAVSLGRLSKRFE